MSDNVAETDPVVTDNVITVPVIQTGEEALAAAMQKAAIEKAKRLAALPPVLLEPTLQLHYNVLADHITGESPNAAQQNVMVIGGRVSEGDLLRAGVDIEWLLSIGSIEEAGYHLAK